jgi:hypothetical protein
MSSPGVHQSSGGVLLTTVWARVRAGLRDAWARPELRWLLAILVLAAVLRIVWVLYAAREPMGVRDPAFYVGYADSIAEGRGYRLPDGPSAYYPIGYPATLAAVFALVKYTPLPDNLVLAGAFFHVALGVTTVALVYAVARRLFDTATGLLAALWVAIFPNLVFHTAAFLTETLFNFAVLAALLVLLWPSWRERRLDGWRLIGFGVLLGFSALVRPISLLWLVLLPIVWLVGRFGWRQTVAYTGVVVLSTAAVIAPWTIRNIIVMDAPVVISTNLGDNLCMGHNPKATGSFGLPEECFSDEPYVGLSRPEFEVQRNNDNIRRAIRYALDHPIDELQLLSRKAYYLWYHDHDGLWAVESYGADPFINFALKRGLTRLADNYYFVTISLGGLGLLTLVAPRTDARRLFLLLALLSFAGIPLVFFGDARFHVPVLPFLSITAAAAVLSLRGVVRWLAAYERRAIEAREQARSQQPSRSDQATG